ncbi:MAG: TetR/AcrR family transcriptional regulator [Bacteroidota bacterium]
MILEAAKKVFLKKGNAGARMQEIADEAGINKALLHYYYRSKEKLFRAVFRVVFSKLMPKIAEVISSDLPLFEKIEIFTEKYIDVLSRNPLIPMFILQELDKNPEGLISLILDLIKDIGLKPEIFFKQVEYEIKMGNIRHIEPRQLIINMFSMCIFPFLGRPLLQRIIFDNDSKHYDRFLNDRKKEVSKFIINSIKIS